MLLLDLSTGELVGEDITDVKYEGPYKEEPEEAPTTTK